MENYRHIDWERTPPEKRGRWGRWLRVKRGVDGQEVVRDTLRKMGRPLGASYYSEMETGRKPVNDDWKVVFVRLYGESADDWDDPWERPAPETDLSGLIAAQTKAIEAQTRVLDELLSVLRARPSLPVIDRLLAEAVSRGLADVQKVSGDEPDPQDVTPEPSTRGTR